MPDIDVGQSGPGASAVQSRPFQMISGIALHRVPFTFALHGAKCVNFVHSANVLTLQTVQTLTTEKTKTAKSQRQRQINININILLRDDQWLCLAQGKMCKFCTQHQCTHSEYCENVDNCAKCKNIKKHKYN